MLVWGSFPLLLQMGILMINHVELLKEPHDSASLIEEARTLFIRVKEESDDMPLKKQALFMEAYCGLAAGDPNAALELLDGTIEAAMPPELIMASAYRMTGRVEDAKAVLQVGIYQKSSFCSIFSRLT